MANVMTLTTPLLRQTVGFDRFNDLFETLLNDKPSAFDNYPPYNIEKIEEDQYSITMAVAGFTMEELAITLENNELTITGTKQTPQEVKEHQFLHRGIANRNFSRTFKLADNIKVIDADLELGLLHIALEREIPEEKKPRSIPIGSKTSVIDNK
jgi:molecular chaperone IbpA